MPPSDLTPSQALDVLDSEEAVPDTEMSFPGHEVTAECDNDDNSASNDMVSIEGKLSSPRESFRRRDNDDDDISQIHRNKIQTQPQPPFSNLIHFWLYFLLFESVQSHLSSPRGPLSTVQ